MKRKIYFVLLNAIGAQSSNDNIWMNFREQDLHRDVFIFNFWRLKIVKYTWWTIWQSYLFGGVGYGPDIDDSNGTDSSNASQTLQTFQVNYNPDVAPRDKSKLKKFADSDFSDLDAFVASECGKYSQELESKKIFRFLNKEDQIFLLHILRLSIYQLCEFGLHVGFRSRFRKSQ